MRLRGSHFGCSPCPTADRGRHGLSKKLSMCDSVWSLEGSWDQPAWTSVSLTITQGTRVGDLPLPLSAWPWTGRWLCCLSLQAWLCTWIPSAEFLCQDTRCQPVMWFLGMVSRGFWEPLNWIYAALGPNGPSEFITDVHPAAEKFSAVPKCHISLIPKFYKCCGPHWGFPLPLPPSLLSPPANSLSL